MSKKEKKERKIKKEDKKEKKEAEEIKEEIKKEFEKVEKEIEEESRKISNSIWFIGVIALLVGLIVGFLIGLQVNKSEKKETILKTNYSLSNEQINKLVKNTLKKAFFDQTGLELDFDIRDYKEEFFFYNVTALVKLPNGIEQEIPVFLSKDGKYLFLGVVKTIEEIGDLCAISKKSEKPEIIVAIMSDCPFGNQIEPIIKEIIYLFGDKIKVEPRYIFYRGSSMNGEYVEANNRKYWSLHGNYELEQGLFELAIWKLYGQKTWIDFVMKVNERCYKGRKTVESVLNCSKNIAMEMGLDIEKIENYLKENKDKLLEEQTSLTADLGIVGSPTVLINNESYKCARSAESLKKSVCSAFITPPPECEKSLDNNIQAAEGSCN